jgi:hypothetical protein
VIFFVYYYPAVTRGIYPFYNIPQVFHYGQMYNTKLLVIGILVRYTTQNGILKHEACGKSCKLQKQLMLAVAVKVKGEAEQKYRRGGQI